MDTITLGTEGAKDVNSDSEVLPGPSLECRAKPKLHSWLLETVVPHPSLAQVPRGPRSPFRTHKQLSAVTVLPSTNCAARGQTTGAAQLGSPLPKPQCCALQF